MKIKLALIFSLLSITAAVTASFRSLNPFVENPEIEVVKSLVQSAYINGAFNALDTDAMRKGFHPDFAFYAPNGEEIMKTTIAEWVAKKEQQKANGYDPKDPKNVWEYSLCVVDVTGVAAQVKVELYNQGKHVFTDYLSLLKFDSGWKIVGKVYHKHG